jgi:hypothetical protein
VFQKGTALAAPDATRCERHELGGKAVAAPATATCFKSSSTGVMPEQAEARPLLAHAVSTYVVERDMW